MHTRAHNIWYIYRFVLYACCTLSSTAFNYFIMHAKAEMENRVEYEVRSTTKTKSYLLWQAQ